MEVTRGAVQGTAWIRPGQLNRCQINPASDIGATSYDVNTHGIYV